MDSICQVLVRANPCAGARRSFPFARNQGKQIGMPPRIAWPSCQCDFVLRKSTSSSLLPAGFHEVTWAPWRYTSPSPNAPVIRTRGSPPLPSHTSATPGIPNLGSSSAAIETVSIFEDLIYRGQVKPHLDQKSRRQVSGFCVRSALGDENPSSWL